MGENEYAEIRERLSGVEASLKSAHHRLDNYEYIIKSVHEMTVKLKFMTERLDELIMRVGAIEQKPAKHWDTLVSGILGAAAGGVGGALIAFLAR